MVGWFYFWGQHQHPMLWTLLEVQPVANKIYILMHILITTICMIFLFNEWFFMWYVRMKNPSCTCGTFKWMDRFGKTWNSYWIWCLLKVFICCEWDGESSRELTQYSNSYKCVLFTVNLLFISIVEQQIFVWLIFFYIIG